MSNIITKSEYFYLREIFSPIFPKKYTNILKNTKNIWSKIKNINIKKDKYKII